jgi:hypothetical protein
MKQNDQEQSPSLTLYKLLYSKLATTKFNTSASWQLINCDTAGGK